MSTSIKMRGYNLTLLSLLWLGGVQISHAAPVASMASFSVQQIAPLCDANIARSKQQLAEFARLNLSPDTAAGPVLAKWDAIFADLENFSGPIGFYVNVDPSAALRDAAEACELKISQFHTQIYQDAKFYQQIKLTKAQNAIDAKYRQDILDAFEDTGVQLAAAQQVRLKAIVDQLQRIEQQYTRNIRDNSQKIEFTAAELQGLPLSYIESLEQNRQGHYLLGFDYPEYNPFMELADNDAARKRYQIAYTRRGGEQNLRLLKQAMDLRLEMAQIFGYASYADWLLRHRMVKNPQVVNRFLAEVHDQVAPLEQKEVQSLTEFQAETLKIPLQQAKIERWNVAYWSEKLRQAKYQIDQEKMRDYFPTQASQDWLLAMSAQLYGIRFERTPTPVWSKEVEYYQVFDQNSGALLGGLYLDKFPRAGKYGHAAVWSVMSGSSLTGRKPVVALVTNFNRKGLNSDELESFVHEFGHALHGLLSQTRYSAQSGTAVELDFVEAPSQMYEEWARRKESLARLADYCSAACPRVDDALVAKLSAAKKYGRGLFYARQTLFAQFDMALHSPEAAHSQPLALWQQLEANTALGYVPSSEFPGQFGHIMGGYEAGYYGYMWSQAIALDMLTAFGDHLINPEVAARYRQSILSQGGQKTAAQMVQDFLGRAPDNQAFFREISDQTAQ
jgi:thimet oligopeptidase